MSDTYTPELGQAIFGNPTQEYDVPEYIHTALSMVRAELDRVMWNIHQREYDSPFDNSGNVEGFACDTFEAHAYDWGAAMDDDGPGQPFNFRWGDWTLSWYKYFGRGMSMSRYVSPDEAARMLGECLGAVRSHYDESVSDEARPF